MSAPFAKSLDELPETTQCVVDGLRRGLLEVFADDLAAIWLYGGSLFAPMALDIDLHVLLARRPQPNDGRRILELHATISNNTRWVNELDCWYILLDDASRPEPPANVGPRHPGIRDEHWPLHRAHGSPEHASSCTGRRRRTSSGRPAGTSWRAYSAAS